LTNIIIDDTILQKINVKEMEKIMEKENTTQKRINEIFDDENIYEELRENIKNSILDELYYSELKDTHFYKAPEVLDQFVDVFIEDILYDNGFKADLMDLNKLRKLDYTPTEMYLFRRNSSGNKPKIDISILFKIEKGERLTPEEEGIYREYEQQTLERDRNNHLAFKALGGDNLNDDEKIRLNSYLDSLISEEEALKRLEEENKPKIKALRKKMKDKYFNKERLSKMPERLCNISDPFDLEKFEKANKIFKGVNGNTEFISIDVPNNTESGYDFEVLSEYIIIVQNMSAYYSKGDTNEHYAHTLWIYIPPRENEYPEGTHLSDLIHKRNMNKWTKEFKGFVDDMMEGGAKIADILKITDSILGEKVENRGKE